MGGGLRRLDNTGGWGGRDRTSEWRNQNPLPYRLATPQCAGWNRETGSRRSVSGHAGLQREPRHFNSLPGEFPAKIGPRPAPFI